MGCFWSSPDSRDLNYRYQPPAANVTSNSTRPYGIQLKPRYGEYRCRCGRYWNSRLSWTNAYQLCKRCGKQVYPHSQRDLRPSDRSTDRREDLKEHEQKYCQMCKQLGYYCGKSFNVTRRQF